MKVLYVVPYIPFHFGKGAKGPKNFSSNILRYVTENVDVDIAIICCDDEHTLKDKLESELPKARSIRLFHIQGGGQGLLSKLKCLFRCYPLAMGAVYSTELAEYLNKESLKYDLIHFDYFSTLLQLSNLPENGPPTLLTCHDAYSLEYYRGFKNAKNWIDRVGRFIRYIMFRHVEQKLYNKVTRVITVSKLDARYLEARGASNIGYIPVPAPMIKLHSNESAPDVLQHSKNNNSPGILVVVQMGGYRWSIKEAIHFVRYGIPRIRDRYGGVCKVTVWGSGAPLLERVIGDIGDIKYLEYVDDYFGFLDGNWIYVYPRIVVAGMHTKVLEALASGLPVVGFCQVMDVFQGKSGVHYYSCDSNEELVNVVGRLYSDFNLRSEMSQNARSLIAENFTLEHVGKLMLDAYGVARNT